MLVGLGLQPVLAEEPSPERIRSAVTKSLPYIAERGQWWIDSKKCVSCHRVAFTIWAHAATAEAGLEVDQEQLNGWVDWSFTALLAKNDKDVVVGTLDNEGVAQMLYATQSLSLTPAQTEQRLQLLALLEAGQQENGSWKPAGQLPGQKRPLEETTFVSTAWNRWLGSAAGLDESRSDKAHAFLQSPPELLSTESLVVQVLDQTNPARSTRALATILREQNQDGGWGWIRKEESDALATGQVLYAIATTSSAKANSSRRLAQEYLLSTQKPDGTWAVKGTKKKKQKSIQETATYWGTCWAAIGLLESLKPAPNDEDASN